MSETEELNAKNPSAQTRFKKGQSGNPRGRPKRTRNLRNDLAKISNREIVTTVNGKSRRLSQQEAVLLTLFSKAIAGDARASTTLTNLLLRLSACGEPSTPANPQPLSENDKQIVENFLKRRAANSSNDEQKEP